MKRKNTFYADMEVGVLTVSTSLGLKPVKTSLSFIDALRQIRYYQYEKGNSFKESIKKIERL